MIGGGMPGTVNFPGKKGSSFSGGMVGAHVEMPEEEREKVKQVSKMISEAMAFRSKWDRHWPRFRNLWEGNHYYAKTVHTLTRAVINQIFSAVETFVGHVADVLTTPNVHARQSWAREKARTITKWLRAEWDRSGAAEELQHVIRSAAQVGVGWVEIPWDVYENDGRGAPGFRPRDENFIFLSPHARNLRDALALHDISNVPREFVESVDRWAERAANVPPGVWYPQVHNQRVYTGAQPEADTYAEFMTTDQAKTEWTHLAGQEGQGSRNLVTLAKTYIRQKDGKMRLLVIANGVVLDDGLSPYDDDDFPYVQFNLIPTLDTYCGRSLSQFVESLQEVVDLSLSYLLDVQRFTADPMLKVNIANLEEGHLIENVPGAILPDRSEGTSGYDWLQGPGFNHQWMQIIENVVAAMDSVLGRVDVLKGERPAGVNTLGGLEIVRDEANVRVRNLIRWVRAGVKRAYMLMLSRLRQFVHDERELLVPDKRGREEYIQINPVVGQSVEGEPVQEKTIPDDAEFELDFGPEEPGGQQAKREFVLTLAATPAEDGLPLVTRRWVLDKLEVDDKDEILQEIEAGKAAMAEAQQPAAGAEGQGGQPVEEDPMRALAALLSGAA